MYKLNGSEVSDGESMLMCMIIALAKKSNISPADLAKEFKNTAQDKMYLKEFTAEVIKLS